jgi:hypothetical protein
MIRPQSPEIERVKDVTAEDEFAGGETILLDPLQEFAQQPRLAVGTTQVRVREDYGIQHQSVLGGSGLLLCKS